MPMTELPVARRRAVLIFGCVLSGCASAPPTPRPAAPATEPAPPPGAATQPELSPGAYALLAENDHVRVGEINLPPGARDGRHASGCAVYVLSGGRTRVHEPESASVDLDAPTGTAVVHPKIEGHFIENVGTSDVRMILMERKSDPPRLDAPYLDAPAAQPEVYRVLAESESIRVLEIVQKPGVEGAPHSHRAAVVYAVEDATVSHTNAGGKPAPQTLKAGTAVPIPAVANHTMTNLGATPTKLIMFELK